MNRRVLFVDDEANVLEAIKRSLRKLFEVSTTSNPNGVLKMMQSEAEFAVIVSDMRMPEISGVQLLTQVRAAHPQIVRIMLTGNHDQQTAVDAVNNGEIFRFLTKPCEPSVLILVLEQAVRQYQLMTAERELLMRTVRGSIKVLADTLSIAKPEAFGRNERVRKRVRELGTQMSDVEPWELDTLALLSTLGCIAVPKSTLDKLVAGRDLTPQERAEYDRHPELGAQLLSAIPRLEYVAQSVLYQNKHYDGSGFPQDDKKGPGIPLGARILHVVHAFDELQSRGASPVTALRELQARRGQFDPEILVRLEKTLGTTPARTARIPALSLEIGQIIAEDVQNGQGILLICRGQVVTAAIQLHLKHCHDTGTLTAPILVAMLDQAESSIATGQAAPCLNAAVV